MNFPRERRRETPNRVVIIDDSTEFRQVLALHLDSLDIRVVGEADNAASGLATVTEATPDLVVTDLQMPDQDGIWLTRQLRTDRPNLPVIMATSRASSPRILDEALEAGVTRLVDKHSGAASVAALVHQELAQSA